MKRTASCKPYSAFLRRIFVFLRHRNGLPFRGSAWRDLTGSHFTVPLNVNAGVVELKTLELAYQLQGAGFLLSAGVTGDGGLGPLQVSFENVGLQLLLEAAGGPGLLKLSASFMPPTGMGVVLNAGPIIGGGFLSIDVPNGRYAAVLQISLFGLGISGFALIDTKLPGGGLGFSFLVLVFADFEAIGGIQLSFGFVLTGVGEVFGIYRSVNTDALRSAVLSNNLDHLLFPTDPIKDALAIISDLRAVFPPTRDEYVFGPIVRVGWGTPVIIEAELGFVLDLPAFTLTLLGSVGVYLPVKPAPIVEVHIDIAGSLDPYVVPTFEAGRLAGLGLDNTGVAGMKLAWTPASGTVSLPVYYQWSFATGPQGDFASLV
jgi:hypothetical protein